MKKLMSIAMGLMFVGSISAHGYESCRGDIRERYYEPHRIVRYEIERPVVRYYEPCRNERYGYDRYDRYRHERAEHEEFRGEYRHR